MSAPFENPSTEPSVDAGRSNPITVPILAEKQVRIKPLVSLKSPEPIPDAKGSLTSDQLREISKRRQPPASWFAGDEEQLF